MQGSLKAGGEWGVHKHSSVRHMISQFQKEIQICAKLGEKKRKKKIIIYRIKGFFNPIYDNVQ